ncbi:hypothetical protein CDHC02_2183 [Corynebacterium diphtheriae HC02]|nr:hypothetical protein CDHC02_2183 [Corynebacterium diphtheriae HC02]
MAVRVLAYSVQHETCRGQAILSVVIPRHRRVDNPPAPAQRNSAIAYSLAEREEIARQLNQAHYERMPSLLQRPAAISTQTQT